MKIEIQNLGPIHHFEIDLEKDLHLLYGENNVGKSFAVNVVYCLMKSLGKEMSLSLSGYATTESEEKSLSMDQILGTRIKRFWNEKIMTEFNKAIKNTYDQLSPKTNYNNKPSMVRVICKNCCLIELVVTENQFFKIGKVGIDKTRGSSLIDKGIPNDKNYFSFIYDFVFDSLSIRPKVFLLPAGRSGLYATLSGMGEIMVKFSQIREIGGTRIELPSLSKPVSDYYINLISANEETKSKLNWVGQEIEKKYLKGEIILNKENRKIYFLPKGASESIHITQVASMISELAPLVLYLKHIVVPDEKGIILLVIEEPEAHLHPKVQVQLMEIFAELTKHNVKVILTSHSDFMLNKVSNMLLSKELEPEKLGIYHMVMTEKGSVIKSGMEATVEGISDNNFANVSEDLYNERLKIYDELNKAQNAPK